MFFSKTSLFAILRKTLSHALLALFCVGILSNTALAWNAPPTVATPTYYDMVPYSNPICGCNPSAQWPLFGGCCIGAKEIMHEIFWGSGVSIWLADDLHNEFYMDTLYKLGFQPFMQAMSATLRNAEMIATISEGSFIDAQNMMLGMLHIQKSLVQTSKNYAPSEQICRFGTLSRSVANSEQLSKVATIGFSTQAVQRQMLRSGMATADAKGAGKTIGGSADIKNRWAQFTTVFCDKGDFNEDKTANNTNPFCTNADDTMHNMDINLSRTLELPYSLELDYVAAPGAQSKDTQSIMALASNLYGSKIITNLTGSDLQEIAKGKSDNSTTLASLKNFFDYRSVVAKRSVAENSLATIAGLKAFGDSASTKYMEEVIKRLGITDPVKDPLRLLGNRPSYDSQMKVLTKLIYQDPLFYANLMDSPANVARQQSAMKGIALAQDRDIYESLRRSEMLLSTLLEVYVEAEQDKFTDRARNR